MGANFTNVTPALKENVAKTAKDILFDVKKMSPLFAHIQAKSGKYDAGGRKFVAPIRYGRGSSVGATFATTQTKASGSTTGSSVLYDRWEVPAVQLHATANFDRLVLDDIQGDSALFDFAQEEIDMKMELIRLELMKNLTTLGWGEIAKLSAVTATTITVPTNLVNRLMVGDDIQASSAISTALLRNSGTALTITAIDPDTGIVTTSSNPTTAGYAVNDYIFRDGNRQNSATPARIMPLGLGAWLTDSINAPGVSDSFCNINRYGNWQTGGHRMSGASVAVKTLLLKAAARLRKFTVGGKIKCFLSTGDFTTLCDSLDTSAVATKQVEMKSPYYNIGWDALALRTPGGTIEISDDPLIADGDGFMGEFDEPENLYLIYSQNLVNLDDNDGNAFLRGATTTTYEARMYSVLNLVCPAPGKFLRLYGVGT